MKLTGKFASSDKFWQVDLPDDKITKWEPLLYASISPEGIITPESIHLMHWIRDNVDPMTVIRWEANEK